MEERQMNITQMDVFSRLMMDRIIFLGTGINDQVANVIQAQLLFLESVDANKDISIYINSPGGGVYAGLGIYDTMQFIKPDVATICTGMAASMGAVLMCAGEQKGNALHCRTLAYHDPPTLRRSTRTGFSDIEITSKRNFEIERRVVRKLSAKHSGQTIEKVHDDSDRDYWMKAEEAKAYGMVDEVLVEK